MDHTQSYHFRHCAASGTADTPALPIKGLILFSGFLINKFIILTPRTPPKVATRKDTAPKAKYLKI